MTLSNDTRGIFIEVVKQAQTGEQVLSAIEDMYDGWILAGKERKNWSIAAEELHGLVGLYANDKVQSDLKTMREGIYR